jgi:hypothetical protein
LHLGFRLALSLALCIAINQSGSDTFNAWSLIGSPESKRTEILGLLSHWFFENQ